jgi:hypothetical protein
MDDCEATHERNHEWRVGSLESEEQWRSEPRDKSYGENIIAWTHGDKPEGARFEAVFKQSHEASLRARFNELVSQWHKEIGYKSSLRRIVFSRAYLTIVLMAVDDDRHRRLITRFILEELRDRGGHWFWALYAITRASPARTEDDFQRARDAWIKWGKANGYLEDQRVA